MRKLLVLIMSAFAIMIFGQTFEGKIIYQNSYESKIPNMSNEQLTSMMGSIQDYIIKEGNYKSSTNGSMMQWQLYINNDNKLYSKMKNSDTIFWNDGATNTDEVLKTEVNKEVTEILGYKCDEIILTCKSGVQKYYFNSKVNVDAILFAKHLFGNWYDFIKISQALPLKSIIESPQFILISEAKEVKQMKFDDKEFQLPENAKLMKSPY